MRAATAPVRAQQQPVLCCPTASRVIPIATAIRRTVVAVARQPWRAAASGGDSAPVAHAPSPATSPPEPLPGSRKREASVEDRAFVSFAIAEMALVGLAMLFRLMPRVRPCWPWLAKHLHRVEIVAFWYCIVMIIWQVLRCVVTVSETAGLAGAVGNEQRQQGQSLLALEGAMEELKREQQVKLRALESQLEAVSAEQQRIKQELRMLQQAGVSTAATAQQG